MNIESCDFVFAGSKRKSKGIPTEQEVHEAGGQKCVNVKQRKVSSKMNGQ